MVSNETARIEAIERRLKSRARGQDDFQQWVTMAALDIEWLLHQRQLLIDHIRKTRGQMQAAKLEDA